MQGFNNEMHINYNKKLITKSLKTYAMNTIL